MASDTGWYPVRPRTWGLRLALAPRQSFPVYELTYFCLLPKVMWVRQETLHIVEETEAQRGAGM